MTKIIIIGALIAILFYSIVRKLGGMNSSYTQRLSTPSEIIAISASLAIYKSLLRKTLLSVGTGALILLVCIILAAKFKIALIMLPLSFYLIGQFFVLSNHIKAVKKQRIFYNRNTHDMEVDFADGKKIKFNLLTDTIKVKEVKAVQKNNGVLLGYFSLKTHSHTVNIPYLIALNGDTQPFFNTLQSFDREIETKLFPVI